VGAGGSQEQLDAHTRDLSASGAFLFLSDSKIEVGAEIHIEIDLTVDPRLDIEDAPKGVCMVGKGVVTRQDSTGMAVSFDGQLRFA
jgi:hypothetical protein